MVLLAFGREVPRGASLKVLSVGLVMGCPAAHSATAGYRAGARGAGGPSAAPG